MTERFLGCTISIDCGETLGVYQGLVTSVDAVQQTISLRQVFRNGLRCQVDEVTLSACDILALNILSQPNIKNEAIGVLEESKRQPIRPLQRQDSHPDTNLRKMGRTGSEGGAFQRFQPKDSPRKFTDDRQQYGSAGSDGQRTPLKKERPRMRQEKDDACFGEEINFQDDFDFEKNLALFNKQAIMQEISAAQKPDVIRLVETNVVKQNYKYDENVLTAAPPTYRQINFPEPSLKEFVTDTGLIVPSVSLTLRSKLLSQAESYGLTSQRRAELTARATTDMAVQLVGGVHRLIPKNAHQTPFVCVLAGVHEDASGAICTARHLASHGVRTAVVIDPNPQCGATVAQELALYRATGQFIVTSIQPLSDQRVDLIIAALEDPFLADSSGPSIAFKTVAINWANSQSAPIIALDPPLSSALPSLKIKCTLIPGLPLAHGEDRGKLYLYNLAIPQQAFQDVGITYSPPFGAKHVIPLHPN